jgi:hypothetical protein
MSAQATNDTQLGNDEQLMDYVIITSKLAAYSSIDCALVVGR